MGMQKTAQRIIDEDINPFVTQWEDEGMYPAAQVFKKLGDAGLLGVNKPVEYGGMGLDFKYNIALNETLGSIHCGGVPMSIAVQTDMATPALARFGSHELKKEFLEPSVLGDKVACLGVSEPGGGSDVAAATTTARRVGDDLVINGQKMWITNAFQADWMCLLANTREGNPHRNKALICLPMDTPGIHPAKNIIGEEGMGFTYQMMQFQEERLAAAAISLTPCVNIINDTIAYTKERKAFGAPLL